MIFGIRSVLVLLCLSLFLIACDVRYSRYEIPELPEFDQAYYGKVLQALDEKIENDPSDPANHYLKAELLYEQDKINAAQLALQKALEINSENTEYQILLARILTEKQDYAGVLEVCRKVEAISGKSAELNSMIAEALIAAGDFKAASEYVDEALLLQPAEPQLYLMKGKILLSMQDTTSAIRQINKAAGMQQQDEAFNLLYQVYRERNMLDSALLYINRQIQSQPDNQQVKLQKGFLLREKKEYPAALQVFRILQQDNPSNTNLLHEMALTHFQSGNYDSAIYFDEKVLENDPRSKDALFLLAQSSEKRYRLSQAAEYYQQILELDSANQSVRSDLLRVYDRIRAFRKAKDEQAEQAIPPQESTGT